MIENLIAQIERRFADADPGDGDVNTMLAQFTLGALMARSGAPGPLEKFLLWEQLGMRIEQWRVDHEPLKVVGTISVKEQP